MRLSKRDKFLIDQGFKAGDSQYYENSEVWLSETIDDAGHTVEDHLAHDAGKVSEISDLKISPPISINHQ